MKEWLKAYISFNRIERMGIIALLSVIIVLVVAKVTMHLWVKPEFDTVKEQQLVKSWEAFKKEQKDNQFTTQKSQYINDDTQKYQHQDKPYKKYDTKTEVVIKTSLFPFDPNTVDSLSLRKLGLKEKTTAIFLHWRAKGKKFYKKEELKKLYTLTPEEYNRLEPYIIINK